MFEKSIRFLHRNFLGTIVVTINYYLFAFIGKLFLFELILDNKK